MNPEDMFRRLHDESRWKVAPMAVPARAVPRPAVVRRFVVPAVVIVAVAALFVGGVQTIRASVPATPPAPTVVPTPLPTETPSPSPTPTAPSTAIPTVATSAWTSPPKIAFNGDCNSLFTEEQVAGFLSVPKARLLSNVDWILPANPLTSILPHNGGMSCQWDDDTKTEAAGTHPVLILTVLSATAFPGVESGIAGSSGNGYSFTTGANGYLVGGTLYFNQNRATTMDVDKVSRDAYAAISTAFPAIAAQQGPPPPPYSQRTGDWPISIGCSSLLSDAGVWSSMHRSKVAAVKRTDNGQPSKVQNQLVSGHGLTACQAGDFADYLLVEALPGGSWLKSDIMALKGVRQVTVSGADSAWSYTNEGEESTITYLFAIDGPNLLVVATSTKTVAAALPAAPGLLRELDKRIATSAAPGSYLTSEGFGNLRIGKSIPDDNGWVTWTPQGCTGGAWIPKESTVHETGNQINKWGFLALPDPKNSHDAPLARILVSDATIPTKSGIRVGDTLADLKRTYGTFDDEYTMPQTGARYYEIKGSAGSVVFMLGGENYAYKAPADVIDVIGVVPAGEKLKDSAARMVQAPCDG